MSVHGIGVPRRIDAHEQNAQNQQRQQKQRQMFHDPVTGKISSQQETLAAFKGRVKEQNDGIIAHEEAHKRAAGPQAIGSPHYNTKTVNVAGHPVSIITGGHQMVAVPDTISFQATKPQIERTMRAAEYAVRGAEAPSSLGGRAGELSDADRSVAEKGRAVLSAAQAAFGKRSELEDRLQRQGENSSGGKLTDKQVARAEQPGRVGEKLNLLG